jgi:hypothetical protein
MHCNETAPTEAAECDEPQKARTEPSKSRHGWSLAMAIG